MTILIVDDEPDMRLVVRSFLERAGLNVVAEASDGQEAVEAFRALNPPPIPTVVVLDNQMPGLTGLQVAEQILAEVPEQRVVLFSAFLDDAVIAEATRRGVSACVPKKDVAKLAGIITALSGPSV